MKAVLCTKYGGPEVLRMSDVEKPIPRNNEVLVRIRSTSVTVADIRIRSFNIPASFWIPARFILGLTKPKKPILGVELSGVIEAVGANVSKFKVGDSIFAASLQQFGAYAEYICLSENGAIAMKPANLSYEEAAVIPIGARTALFYLRKANIQRGQRILIYGASGSVGSYAVQLAKHFGAIVTGVCSDANRQLVTSLGADIVLDYKNPEFLNRLETYDCIFVAIDKLPFSKCKQFIVIGGVYVNVTSIVKGISMIRASLLSNTKIILGQNAPESSDDLKYLADLCGKGIVKPIIDCTYTLDQIAQAHEYVDKGHKRGNVAITV